MEKTNVKNKLILVELNEINFDVVQYYLHSSPKKYPSLEKLTRSTWLRTKSESEYSYLEPWIQWPSVHTGLTFADHGIFRLGDIVGSKVPQLFEILEINGFSVGCISAMNAENRLNHPAYFIPDPWTSTPTYGGFWAAILADAVRQAVNDNAQSKITFVSALSLFLCFFKFAKIKHYKIYFKLAFGCINAPWRKALFLDLLLHDVHLNLFSCKSPDFSVVFHNAGAHIQHHYFFNSKYAKVQEGVKNPEWYISEHVDPFEEMIQVYDVIVGECLSLDNTNVIVATGLAQKPYDRVKYYYRLKNHELFLKQCEIKFSTVSPRMTRDFLIDFETCEEALAAEFKLKQLIVYPNCEPLFREIDNRGSSLFVTLTFPFEISQDSYFNINGLDVLIYPHVAFVAIKNGMHQEDGFAYFTSGLDKYAPRQFMHVREIFYIVLSFFGVTLGDK